MKKLLIIVVLVLAFPSVAEAASPAKVASARAKLSYQRTTHVFPKNWNSKCHKRAQWAWWRCTSTVWNGSYRGTFKILVKGDAARITSVVYVR